WPLRPESFPGGAPQKLIPWSRSDTNDLIADCELQIEWMPNPSDERRDCLKPHLLLIKFIGVMVPRRLRADWRLEWEAAFRSREMLLADWDRLGWRDKLDLFGRRVPPFWDSLALR